MIIKIYLILIKKIKTNERDLMSCYRFFGALFFLLRQGLSQSLSRNQMIYHIMILQHQNDIAQTRDNAYMEDMGK